MNGLGRLLFALLVLHAGNAAPAAENAGSDAVAEVAARIAKAPLLRGRFEQMKQVVGFRKPLRSEGRFVLARERGILWQSEKPFASLLIVTPESLVSETAGATQRIDTAQEPALRAINAILFDLIGGDIARLRTRFDVQATPLERDRWQLKLQPRSGPLAQTIVAIELAGARHVERVLLVEANGDRTEITFSELAQGTELSTEEAARLAR